MKKNVEALTSFDHGGDRRKGSRFTLPQRTAEQLASKGLVRILDGDPEQAAGAPSSASPVAQASPQTTVNESADGEKEETQEETQEAAPTNQSGNKKNKRRGR